MQEKLTDNQKSIWEKGNMKIPRPTPVTEVPNANIETFDPPEETKQNEYIPDETAVSTKTPNISPNKEKIPEISPQKESNPEITPEKSEMPPEIPEENCIVFNGKTIEIKPTKLKYFRNKTAAAYNILKTYPLTEILPLDKGIIDAKRDGDAIVFDFLIAAFDDITFVRDHYNEFDADQIEKVVNIFGRINHIDEKVEAQQRKNREAQASH